MPTHWNITVIIRTYTDKRWEYFEKAVESAFAQNMAPHEVVLVVDHNPALFDRVRTRFPAANVVENTQSRGSGGAWNMGIAVASGDILAFLDDDAIAEPDWLAQLCVPYDDPNVVGVGGTIEPIWESGKPAWFPAEFYWVVGCTYKGMPETLAPMRNLIGCNMSFRREAFENILGFRSEIGHANGKPLGCDETEFCIRLGQRYPEKLMMHQPPAKVRHHVPASRAKFSYLRQRCFYEGRSKALVAQFVGSKDGLASERRHTLVTLPQGVLRGLADGLRGDLGGLGRSFAIVAGLATAACSYLGTSVALRFKALVASSPKMHGTPNVPATHSMPIGAK
jgi:GT2 family glycosyltransferase